MLILQYHFLVYLVGIANFLFTYEATWFPFGIQVISSFLYDETHIDVLLPNVYHFSILFSRFAILLLVHGRILLLIWISNSKIKRKLKTISKAVTFIIQIKIMWNLVYNQCDRFFSIFPKLTSLCYVSPLFVPLVVDCKL